jgi:hypothetical protein
MTAHRAVATGEGRSQRQQLQQRGRDVVATPLLGVGVIRSCALRTAHSAVATVEDADLAFYGRNGAKATVTRPPYSV